MLEFADHLCSPDNTSSFFHMWVHLLHKNAAKRANFPMEKKEYHSADKGRICQWRYQASKKLTNQVTCCQRKVFKISGPHCRARPLTLTFERLKSLWVASELHASTGVWDQYVLKWDPKAAKTPYIESETQCFPGCRLVGQSKILWTVSHNNPSIWTIPPNQKQKKNTHAPSGFTNNLTCNTEDVFCCSSSPHPTTLQPTPGYLGVFVEVPNPKPSNPHLEGKSTTLRLHEKMAKVVWPGFV